MKKNSNCQLCVRIVLGTRATTMNENRHNCCYSGAGDPWLRKIREAHKKIISMDRAYKKGPKFTLWS